ncbi:MAG: EamA family transporter [Alphaproteobacteria bacterium]
MSVAVLCLVLLAALMHAAWNALIKQANDRLFMMSAMSAVGIPAGLAFLPWAAAPAEASWPYLALTTAIHAGYYLFLLRAYRIGDLSQVYPIARGGSPLLLALASGPLIGERLSAQQYGGVALISLGLASLSLGRGHPRAILYALGTACFIAAYSAVDALGVRLSESALGYIAWLWLLDGAMMIGFSTAYRRRPFLSFLAAEWKQSLFAGLLAVAGYSIVVWCYGIGTVAPISALRETSVVFAALIGTIVLKEPFGLRRVIAATTVASGILVMNL